MSKTNNYYPWLEKSIREIKKFIEETKQELELFDKHMQEVKTLYREEDNNVTKD